MVVLAAGDTAHLAGPGDRITVPMAQSTWAVLFMDTAMRAAQAGCGPFLTSHEGRAHAGWWWWWWWCWWWWGCGWVGGGGGTGPEAVAGLTRLAAVPLAPASGLLGAQLARALESGG